MESKSTNGLRFRKYEALGNDYLVVDPRDCVKCPNPAAIRTLCDRRYGVGSDGLLFGPIVEPRGFRVRIFNPDGREAEKSGNGIRIFARYLHDAGYVLGAGGTIVTEGGEAPFRYLDSGARRVRVDMGRVTFWSPQIPVAGAHREAVDEVLKIGDRSLTVCCLSIGNPHCVVWLGEATEADARTLGPQIETHPMFPNRVNVQFLEVAARDHVRIKIWERGAGYTLASGTSSCAAASAARRLKLVDDHVRVEMPGGYISVDFDRNDNVCMTGDVRATFQGIVTGDLAAALRLPPQLV